MEARIISSQSSSVPVLVKNDRTHRQSTETEGYRPSTEHGERHQRAYLKSKTLFDLASWLAEGQKIKAEGLV
jgi:hypothetical protein